MCGASLLSKVPPLDQENLLGPQCNVLGDQRCCNLLQRSFLDSVSTISVFGFTNYKDAKEKELNKGLDLKGGINVILQISVKDILKGLAENTNDPNFNKALDNADELQKSSNDTYLEIFLNLSLIHI